MIMDDSGHRVTHCVHDCQELSVASSLQPSVASDLSELLPNVHMLYIHVHLAIKCNVVSVLSCVLLMLRQ